jgi:hypothetical protein
MIHKSLIINITGVDLNKVLLICPKEYTNKINNVDIIRYDMNKDWIDTINNVGMEKSLIELKRYSLYKKVIFTNNINDINTESVDVSRNMIYSYDCGLEYKNTESNNDLVNNRLSLKKPNLYNWYSDSLTFDIISNITKKLWEKLEYNHKKGDVDKFLCYLSMMNIHIEKL